MRCEALFALTRHFAQALVAPPILTGLGVDFLRRTIAGVIAMLLVSGIFVTRALFKKYLDLDAQWDEPGYLRAVQADTLLMIALPMLVVGIFATLLSPMLFPDETDYRTLAPLPITRLELFGAKLLAVSGVVVTGVLAVTAVTTLWFPAAIGGRWMPYALAARVSAHAVAALAGSLWAAGAAMAVYGLCLVVTPVGWRRQAASAVQAGMFFVLLLTIPFVLRIPTLEVSADHVAVSPLIWMPPIWFLGVERWLLDPSAAGGYADAAAVALVAAVGVAITIAASYVVLYRSAERLAATVGHVSVICRGDLVGSTSPVVAFTIRALLRSRLHQMVLLLVVGAGIAILIGQRASLHALFMAPLLVALCTTLALRTVFLLPLDEQANWIFRLTETPRTRRHQLDAVVRMFVLGGLVPALALCALVHPAALGSRWVWSATFSALAALLLVEVIVREWRRIPFTCTYLPGKRVLAYTLGVLFASYAVFVYIGAAVIHWAVASAPHSVVYAGALLTGWLALRRERLRTWAETPLEFEDEDPLAPRSLGLIPDERP